MKKLTSVILIIAMLFGLCSCGKQSFSGDALTAIFKGNGTKRLTISFEYPELASLSRVALVPDDELTEPVYSTNLVKAKGDTVTYKLVGKAEGSANFTVAFTTADGTEMSCTMLIQVSDKKKITFSNLSFGDSPEYTKLDGNTFVTYYEGSSKTISLAAEGGIWAIGLYDEEDVSVEQQESTTDEESAEEYYNFLVTAVSAGETTVQFINREIEKQIVFRLSITEVVEDDSENGTRLSMTLIDYYTDIFTKEDDIEYQKRKKATKEDVQKIFGDDIIFPDGDGFTLEDAGFNNDDKSSVYDENGEVTDCDNVDAVYKIDGNVLDYVISKTKTFTQACNELLEADEQPPVVLDLEIGDSTVRYYYTIYGFSEAIWTQGQYTSVLVFMGEDQTDKGNRKILYKFLGHEDEYHE